MRSALPVILFAGPAFAHHETAVIASLPLALPALMVVSAAVVAVWVRWTGHRK